jgi:hypothetical protein
MQMSFQVIEQLATLPIDLFHIHQAGPWSLQLSTNYKVVFGRVYPGIIFEQDERVSYYLKFKFPQTKTSWADLFTLVCFS